jgi:hypothetical protein
VDKATFLFKSNTLRHKEACDKLALMAVASHEQLLKTDSACE